MLKSEKYFMLDFVQFLTTGQKFDNLPPNSNIEALEVGH
jgi:hypothetical protein